MIPFHSGDHQKNWNGYKQEYPSKTAKKKMCLEYEKARFQEAKTICTKKKACMMSMLSIFEEIWSFLQKYEAEIICWEDGV